jgi:cell division protein FtsZ
MFQRGIHHVEFAVCNTDRQALDRLAVPKRVLMGQKTTGGLGCGSDPSQGTKAAQESIDDIMALCQSPIRMAFLTAGLGGGTGTGSIPIVAEHCRAKGLLTVAVITLPFSFEGEARRRNAIQGLLALEPHVDALVVIHNDNIRQIAGRDIRQKQAFLLADEVLYRAVRGIAEIITKPGYINVDFADVQAVMKGGGYALLGMSIQKGNDRAQIAVEEALSSPLLDHIDIRGAQNVLVNITASEETLRMDETETIMRAINQAIGGQAEEPEARIIMGQVFDEMEQEDLSLTLIVTGLERPPSIQSLAQKYQQAKKPIPNRPNTPPPPIQPELPLDKSATPHAPPPPAVSQPLEERILRIQSNPDQALKEAMSRPAYERLSGIKIPTTPPPPHSQTTIEPSTDPHMQIRRHNPRLYQNPD